MSEFAGLKIILYTIKYNVICKWTKWKWNLKIIFVDFIQNFMGKFKKWNFPPKIVEVTLIILRGHAMKNVDYSKQFNIKITCCKIYVKYAKKFVWTTNSSPSTN